MPIRLIPDGTNFSSMLMDTLSLKRTTMSSKFQQVEQTHRTDKSLEQARMPTNGNNGRSCTLMRLNQNQHLDTPRSLDFGSTDHST